MLKPIQLPLSDDQINSINAHLASLRPHEILAWAIENLPGLFQTTAFGLTGTVIIDMLSRLTSSPPQLIFIDTLYHFNETLDLLERVKRKYGIPVSIYHPQGVSTVGEFEDRYGKRLWENDEDRYDYLVKVEPARRAYQELGVQSVITGRRATQGASRAMLQPLEVDSTGLIKLNPLFSWTYEQVKNYVDEYDVPRNPLLDLGYRSVGDWHSTKPVAEGASERDGRWAGTEKTECGLHKDYFAMRIAAQKKKREAELRRRDELREEGDRAYDQSEDSNPSSTIESTAAGPKTEPEVVSTRESQETTWSWWWGTALPWTRIVRKAHILLRGTE